MFLETPSLILRKIREEDFPDYCAYNLNDPERDRMMGRDRLDSMEAVRANFNWLKDKEERAYVLIHKDSGRLIGNLTIYNRGYDPTEHPEVAGKKGFTLSFGIAGAYQRQGFALEAVRAVIEQLFEQEHADYIGCGCFSYNIPSQRLQEKLGFRFLFSECFELFGEQVEVSEHILWHP